MKLFRNILAHFQVPPAPAATPSDSDAEFLEVVMREARERTRAEVAARQAAAAQMPPSRLPAAA
jgi:hypothetical protein